TPKTAADPDRRAAEWGLSLKPKKGQGFFQMQLRLADGSTRDVETREPFSAEKLREVLPSQKFFLVRAVLNGSDDVTDAALATYLSPLAETLEVLRLSDCGQVTDGAVPT